MADGLTDDAALDAHIDTLFEEAPPEAQAAPATEAPPPAETVEQAAAEPATPPVAETSPGQAPASKARADLLAKYNGDVDAAATAYWETNNRAAQLARENDELKAKLTSVPAAPPAAPEPPKPAAVPIEVQRYDTDMREAETAWKEAGTALQNCVAEKSKIEREQQRITRDLMSGRVPVESEENARRRWQELAEASTDYDREIARLQQEQNASVRDYRDAKDRKGLASQLAELANARQAEIQRRDTESLQRFGRTLFGAIDTLAQEGTDKVPAKLQPRFKAYVQEKAMLRLTAPGTDLDTQDVNAFVREVKADFIALVKESHSGLSSVYAESKTADMTTKAPEGKKAVAPVVKTSRFSTDSEVDDALNAGFGL